MSLFNDISFDVRKNLIWDSVARYSSTHTEPAQSIARILSTLGSASCTDATACVGATTRFISEHFELVTAIELDSGRFYCLQNNMDLLGIQNVTCVRGDCLVVCPFKQDVIFLDPPWGGPEYKHLERVHLTLGTQPIEEVLDRLSERARFIALKVPVNVDDSFLDRLERCKLSRRYFLQKMNLYIFLCGTIK